MKIPETLKAFNEEELSLIVDKLNRNGIIGEWEAPLIAHFMDVKSWGYTCLEYITQFGGIKYPLKLVGSSSGTDRLIYDSDRYTEKQAIIYASNY